jgi:predicted RecA/RadA family phage recombinase
MFFEKKPVSDHILIPSFPAAKNKGDLVVYGSLKGFSDYNTPSGEQGSIDIGMLRAVFQIAIGDITGDPAAGSILYVTSAGELTMTATSNTAFATILSVGAESVDIVPV